MGLDLTEPDHARRDRIIAAVWTVMERQRFPDRPDLRTPAADVPGETAIWNQRAYARAIEIAEAVLAVDRQSPLSTGP